MVEGVREQTILYPLNVVVVSLLYYWTERLKTASLKKYRKGEKIIYKFVVMKMKKKTSKIE